MPETQRYALTICYKSGIQKTFRVAEYKATWNHELQRFVHLSWSGADTQRVSPAVTGLGNIESIWVEDL